MEQTLDGLCVRVAHNHTFDGLWLRMANDFKRLLGRPAVRVGASAPPCGLCLIHHCAVLRWAKHALCCAALCCAALCHPVLRCNALGHAVLLNAVLSCALPCCAVHVSC